MKNVFLLTVLLVSVLTGCSEKDEDKIDPQTGNFVKFKADGISYQNVDPELGMSVSFFESDNLILINFQTNEAASKITRSAYLQFELTEGPLELKKYELSAKANNVRWQYYNYDKDEDIDVNQITGTGTLEFTEHVPNQYVVGKFHFTTSENGRTFDIKEGEFKVDVNF